MPPCTVAVRAMRKMIAALASVRLFALLQVFIRSEGSCSNIPTLFPLRLAWDWVAAGEAVINSLIRRSRNAPYAIDLYRGASPRGVGHGCGISCQRRTS